MKSFLKLQPFVSNRIAPGLQNSTSTDETSTDENLYMPPGNRRLTSAHVDDHLKTPGLMLYFVICWAICLAVFCWYVYIITTTYLYFDKNPGSTFSLVTPAVLTWPLFTVCNWNQVSDRAYLSNLRLLSCSNNAYLPGQPEYDCSSLWVSKNVTSPFGVFICAVYNENLNLTTNDTGYFGSISSVWAVPLPFRSIPLDPTIPLDRIGMQISFTPNMFVDNQFSYNDTIAGETNFALPQHDTLFR